jgi:DNA replication and repair protein RecF
MNDVLPSVQTVQRPRIERLVLNEFRSYAALDFELTGQMIVLTGLNGAGKTNILEALSFLCLGRGLRRADLRECSRNTGEILNPWAVSVEIRQSENSLHLGTGFDPTETTRKCRVNRTPVTSASAFAEYVRIIWLTPAMDGLFSGSAGERRRFLDRLVLTVDSTHGARVNALDRALRNRNRLLSEALADRLWLDAAEREVAELSIAVTTARHEALTRLQALILQDKDTTSPFPWAEISLEGEIDQLCLEHPAVIAEEKLREMLRSLRHRDAASGRTSVGPHISDLRVKHGPKSADAAQCSTGEQKALLTGLILAHARLVTQMTGLSPFILLDEIAAHFDPSRREALFSTLEQSGAQVWMTGADGAAFTPLHNRAEMFQVEQGRLIKS